MKPAIENLPPEIAFHIFCFLSRNEILNCLCVNKAFAELAKNDSVFYIVCEPLLDAIGTKVEYENRPTSDYYAWFEEQGKLTNRLLRPIRRVTRADLAGIAQHGLLVGNALKHWPCEFWLVLESYRQITRRSLRPTPSELHSRIVLRVALVEGLKAVRLFNTFCRILLMADRDQELFKEPNRVRGLEPVALTKSMNLYLAVESIVFINTAIRREYPRQFTVFNVPRFDNLLGKCEEALIRHGYTNTPCGRFICKWYFDTLREAPELTSQYVGGLHSETNVLNPGTSIALELAILCRRLGLCANLYIHECVEAVIVHENKSLNNGEIFIANVAEQEVRVPTTQERNSAWFADCNTEIYGQGQALEMMCLFNSTVLKAGLERRVVPPFREKVIASVVTCRVCALVSRAFWGRSGFLHGLDQDDIVQNMRAAMRTEQRGLARRNLIHVCAYYAMEVVLTILGVNNGSGGDTNQSSESPPDPNDRNDLDDQTELTDPDEPPSSAGTMMAVYQIGNEQDPLRPVKKRKKLVQDINVKTGMYF